MIEIAAVAAALGATLYFGARTFHVGSHRRTLRKTLPLDPKHFTKSTDTAVVASTGITVGRAHDRLLLAGGDAELRDWR
ncbi:MAG: hypothetical protein O7H41_21495 [Planctomycetota bacterium]|nr:hypothetical protein [Planctomycetota bacterium]